MKSAIKGLSHITLVCKDIEKSAALFKTLGAEEIYSSDGKNFSISKEKFLALAGLWIALMEGDPIEKSYNHIAFQINESDLPIVENQIRSLGLTILPGRKRHTAEGDSLYFYDYDNHLLELPTGTLDARLSYYNAP